jgi:hypothetical protein
MDQRGFDFGEAGFDFGIGFTGKNSSDVDSRYGTWEFSHTTIDNTKETDNKKKTLYKSRNCNLEPEKWTNPSGNMGKGASVFTPRFKNMQCSDVSNNNITGHFDSPKF